MLDIRTLVKHYDTLGSEPVRAVDGVSITVESGELVAIYGPSGSGKTTLLKLIAAVMKPDRGEIVVGGRDVCQLGDRAASAYRLHELGFVLQSFHLIAGLSAIDNAVLKLLEAYQRITPLLARLDIDAQAEQPARELSAGQQQRVALAKALSTDPGLVLADEPTGNLDTRGGRAVLTLLHELCREHGTATVLVTHDPEALEFADRAYALRDGALVDHLPEDAPTLEAR